MTEANAKTLEWKCTKPHEWQANSPYGVYVLTFEEPGDWGDYHWFLCLMGPDIVFGYHETEEDAKKVAQEDFEQGSPLSNEVGLLHRSVKLMEED